jgi:WD repeat-containing protein mio
MVAQESSPDSALPQVWLWIHRKLPVWRSFLTGLITLFLDIQQLLSAPPAALDGFNFSYQGILGVWEGFRPGRSHISAHPTPRLGQRGLLLDIPTNPASNLLLDTHPSRSRSRQADGRRSKPGGGGTETPQDDFAAAVATLLAEKLPSHASWRPAVATGRLAQRQLALHMCAWSLAEDDLARAVRRWEREHRHTQAACWLVFTKQHRAAVELLMRSKGVLLVGFLSAAAC